MLIQSVCYKSLLHFFYEITMNFQDFNWASEHHLNVFITSKVYEKIRSLFIY